jgi:hypothetical protein
MHDAKGWEYSPCGRYSVLPSRGKSTGCWTLHTGEGGMWGKMTEEEAREMKRRYFKTGSFYRSLPQAV